MRAVSPGGISSSPSEPTRCSEPSSSRSSSPLSSSPRTVSIAYSGIPSARSTMRARGPGQAEDEPVQDLADDCVRQWVERQGRDRPAGESESFVIDALRTRQHEEKQRVVARPLEQVIQELEQAGVGPLQVLDEHHNRAVLGQPLEEQAPSREQLFSRQHLWRQKTEQLAEAWGNELSLSAVGDPPFEAGPESLADDLLWILLADLQSGSHHLRERPVAHALPVGETPAGVPEHGSRQAVGVLEELPGKTRLAHAGHAGYQHQSCRVALGRDVEELLEEVELVVPPEERGLQDSGALRAGNAGDDLGRPEEPHGFGLSLQLVLAGVCVGDRGRRGGPGCLVDITGPRESRGLDARGGVHTIADDETFLRGLGRGHAAGHDPHPSLETNGTFGPVRGDRRDELETGSHRAFGVVLLRHRRTPDGHDGVADELLDDAPVTPDDGAGELEVTREDFADLLGVAFLREGREADEVAEQHRDVAQLGGRCSDLLSRVGRAEGGGRCVRWSHRSFDRRPAVTAELADRPELCSARGADSSQRSAAVLTKPFAVRVIASTRWAAHPSLLHLPEGYRRDRQPRIGQRTTDGMICL